MPNTEPIIIELSAEDNASKEIAAAGKKIAESSKEMSGKVKMSLEDAKKKLGEYGEGLKNGVKQAGVFSAGMIGAFAAFATKGVKDMASLAEELDNLHKSTGIATETLSTLKYAAGQTSVPLETMTNGVKKLQLAQGDLKGFTKNLDELGLSSKELLKLPIDEQFFKIGNEISKLPDATDRTNASMQFFGKTGTDLLPIFGDGAKSLDEWRAAAKKAGVQLDEETIQSLLDADQSFDDFDDAVKGLTMSATKLLTPALTSINTAFTPLIEQATAWVEKNPELVTSMAKWTGEVGLGFIALSSIVKAFELLNVAVKGLGAMNALVGALTGISLLQFAGIAALVVGLKYIYDNWESISNGARKIADNLGLVNSASGSMGSIKNLQKTMKDVGPTAITSTPTTSTASGWQEFQGGLDLWNANLRSSIIGSISDSISYITGPGFAAGGEPPMNEPSIVGEMGPEVFIPKSRGTIVPNHELGGTTIIQNFSNNQFLDRNSAEKIFEMAGRKFFYANKVAS